MHYSRVERLHQHRVVRKQRFGIRKVSALGAVSALLGTAVFFSAGVRADEVTDNQSTAVGTETIVANIDQQEDSKDTTPSAESDTQVTTASSSVVNQTSEADVVSNTSEVASVTASNENEGDTVASQENVKTSETETNTVVETTQEATSSSQTAVAEKTVPETTAVEDTASMGSEATDNPAVGVINYDKNKTTFDVAVVGTDSSKAIKGAHIAVWSADKGQDDLKWYAPVAKDNQIRQTINILDHAGNTDDYFVHVYTDYVDGTTYGVNLGSYHFDVPRDKTLGNSASQGKYNVINRVVYLDAGHGGSDPGASYFGQSEKNLTLSVQNLVKKKLEAAGYNVITSRNIDATVELLDRSNRANNSQADIFVSLHFNAGSQGANGVETYYYQYDSQYPSKINQIYHNNAERLKRSSELAQAIQSNVVAQTGSKNNGVKRETFAVVRETTAPAVLVELGFISNQAEFNKINTAAYQEKLAEGVTKGILAYYDKYRPSTSLTKPTPTPTEKPEIKVENYSKDKPTFDVVVRGSEKTKQIKDAHIAVWSADKGQDDLKWYAPVVKNNQVHQTINILDHAGNTDDYIVHVYTDYTDGTTSAVNLGSYHIDIPEP
ncbi:N-acetylmuramoyl-L-alanine amidase, partial [Streptococcus sciuri]